jgi:hypothetical protein
MKMFKVDAALFLATVIAAVVLSEIAAWWLMDERLLISMGITP